MTFYGSKSWSGERAALLFLLVVWAFAAVPSLSVGLFADDWFQIRPRGMAELAATFTGDWNYGAHGTGAGFYRPLVRVSFALDRLLWNASPVGCHAFNALLLLGVMLGVRALVNELTRGTFGAPVGVAMAALFAVNPLNAEALFWVSGRGDLLAACFGVWAVVCAVRVARGAGTANVITALALVAGALWTKEIGVAVAAVTALAAFMFRSEPESRKRAATVGIGALALLALYLVVRQWAIGGIGGYLAGREAPIGIGEIATNVLRHLGALALPGYQTLAGRYHPAVGILWLATAAALIVISARREPGDRPDALSFCAPAVLISIAPIAMLGLSPIDGTRVLVLASALQAAMIGVALDRLCPAFWRGPSLLAIAGVCAVHYITVAGGLGRDFRTETAPAAMAVAEADAAFQKADPSTVFIVLDPPDIPGQRRILIPGMTMLLALETKAAERGARTHHESGRLVIDAPEGQRFIYYYPSPLLDEDIARGARVIWLRPDAEGHVVAQTLTRGRESALSAPESAAQALKIPVSRPREVGLVAVWARAHGTPRGLPTINVVKHLGHFTEFERLVVLNWEAGEMTLGAFLWVTNVAFELRVQSPPSSAVHIDEIHAMTLE